jgi:hypothetical protein
MRWVTRPCVQPYLVTSGPEKLNPQSEEGLKDHLLDRTLLHQGVDLVEDHLHLLLLAHDGAPTLGFLRHASCNGERGAGAKILPDPSRP